MTNPIEIKPITEADFESFHACLDSVGRERKFLGFIEAPPREQTSKWLKAGSESGEIRLVALDEFKVVGWCDIEISHRAGFTHAGRLGMGILAEYRRQGLGSRPMKEILSIARSRNLERIELDVYASNTSAIGLYEKFNFVVEGRKYKARKLDGIYDDIISMALFFS